MNDLTKFFRSNPQAFALLLICLILGIGTAIAVIIGVISSGSTTTTGAPEGVVTALRALAG